MFASESFRPVLRLDKALSFFLVGSSVCSFHSQGNSQFVPTPIAGNCTHVRPETGRFIRTSDERTKLRTTPPSMSRELSSPATMGRPTSSSSEHVSGWVASAFLGSSWEPVRCVAQPDAKPRPRIAESTKLEFLMLPNGPYDLRSPQH